MTPPAASGIARARICGRCGHGKPAVGGYIACGERPWILSAPTKGCFWEPVRWVEAVAQVQAKRDAQAGIDQAADAAERAFSGWGDTAYAFICLFCVENRGRQVIGHEIVQASIAKGVIQPPNQKAWGAPIQRAAREKLLERVGYAPDPNRHTNPVPLWRVA